MSARDTHCTAFGIHPVPANLSKREFERKCEALVESLLATPVAQRNFLKFDIIFQNEQLKEHITALEIPEPRPIVCLRVEYETEDSWAECHRDPDYMKALDAGKSWGFHDDACIFSAAKVSKGHPNAPRDSNVVVGIIKAPGHMSATEFQQRLEGLIDAVYGAKKPAIKWHLYVQNMNAEEHLQAAGYPPSQPVLAILAESKSWDEVIQLLTDAECKSHIESAKKDSSFHVESICFSADVVEKFRRPGA